ncbi:hypothetical protein AAIH25_09430 [Arthrobacter crystallopoietes]
MNVGMPPRSRNQRVPSVCDTPTEIAAASLVHPVVIARQNARSVSRRNDGFPGDSIGDLPVNAVIQPAGLPITTSRIEALRQPVEFVL